MSKPTRRFDRRIYGTMHESPHGDWVRYDDFKTLTQRAEAAEDECESLRRRLSSAQMEAEAEHRACERVIAERDALRKDVAMLCGELAGSWLYGDWKADTLSEREQEAVMRRLGWWPITEAELIDKRDRSAAGLVNFGATKTPFPSLERLWEHHEKPKLQPLRNMPESFIPNRVSYRWPRNAFLFAVSVLAVLQLIGVTSEPVLMAAAILWAGTVLWSIGAVVWNAWVEMKGVQP